MKAVRFTALVGTALLLLFQWGSAAYAQAPIIVALDMDPTGNSCPGDGVNDCTLGPIDSCVSVNAGDSFTFDIVVDGLPYHYAGEGQYAFDFQLLWGPSVVPVEADVIDITARTAVSSAVHYLQQAAGSSATLGDPQALPLTTPPYVASVSDLATDEPNPPWTQGTGWRGALTVDALAANGIYKLEFDPSYIGVFNVVSYNECQDPGPGCTLHNATFAVGMPCPEAPTATATPTPSPTVPPTPTPEPFTPTQSITFDEVAPDNLDILPADDECPVGAACKLLAWTELPDGQPGWDGPAVVPAPVVGLAADALVPNGAVTGRSSLSVRVGPMGSCATEGTITSVELTWLDGTTDGSTTTGSPSDLCSFSHWPTQLNGIRDGFLATNPGVVLDGRRVGSQPTVCANALLFTQTDGSILYYEFWGDPTAPPTYEWCGPYLHKEVFLGLSADNPETPADEGGIPLFTCTAPGTQTFRGFFDRNDTPPGDPLVLEDTSVCSPNTPAGSGVSVPLNGGTAALAGIDLTFSNVAGGGTTSVVTTTAGPPPPTGFKIVGLAEIPLYFDINTDASYSGELTVCVRYDETQVEGPESALRLMQRVDDSYVDVTTSVDTVSNIICGTTAHLSIFIVAQPLPAVGGVVELQRGPSAPAAQQSGSAGPPYAALAAAAALGAIALTAGAWYARRRWRT